MFYGYLGLFIPQALTQLRQILLGITHPINYTPPPPPPLDYLLDETSWWPKLFWIYCQANGCSVFDRVFLCLAASTCAAKGNMDVLAISKNDSISIIPCWWTNEVPSTSSERFEDSEAARILVGDGSIHTMETFLNDAKSPQLALGAPGNTIKYREIM